MDSSTIETMHTNADRRIIVGEENQFTFAVCSSAMSLACVAWSKMFSPPDVNARYTYTEQYQTDIEFPDDDPEPLRIVLKIIHLRFSELPKTVDFGLLGSLAALCNKYDLSHLVQAWAGSWIDAIKDKPSVLYVSESTIPWLNIAYVFRDLTILKNAALAMVTNMTLTSMEDTNGNSYDAVRLDNDTKMSRILFGLAADHEEYPLSEIIPDIIDQLAALRTETISKLLEATFSRIQAFCKSLRPFCVDDNHACDLLQLGALLRGVGQAGIVNFSSPTAGEGKLLDVPKYRKSVTKLSITLKSIDWKPSHLHDECHKRPEYHEDIDKAMNAISGRVEWLCRDLLWTKESHP
ncbi:MAG: hypothetical protein M1820_006057 [Bogoriella megaspora]|nr:MAG: hypothetical protein M1820_006057 [Bogoriella megaspora]